jgi:hypothetical protein
MGNHSGTANLQIACPERSRTGALVQILGKLPRSISFCGALLLSTVAVGCAAPGDPYERKPPTPTPVTDLTAVQAGNAVALTFSLPQQAVDKRLLPELPSVEIYRSFTKAPPPGGNDAVTVGGQLLVTIPAARVDSYVEQGHFRYTDSFTAQDFAQQPDSMASYAVRTSVSEKKRSEMSNVVTLRIYPAAVPIADLKTEVTHPAIVLTWTPPDKALSGSAPSIIVYHIYRGSTDVSAPATGAESKLKSLLLRIADAQAPPFQDTQFEFGASYIYSVRSVSQYPGGATIESADSNLAAVSPRDTFAPAAPQGLVVVLVPRQGDTPAHLELSWAISPETDIAGYNVYRSEQEGAKGLRLTDDTEQKLLPTPAFSDMNAQPGHRYFYTVTAVDRAGNESPATAVVSSDVPAESQTTP